MRRVGMWVLAAVCVLLLLVLFNLFAPAAPRRTGPFVTYSDVLAEAAAGRLREAALQGRLLTGTTAEGRTIQAYLPEDPALASRLAGQGVRVSARPDEEDGNPALRLFISWLPSLLFLGVWVVSLRRIGNEVRALRRTLDGIAARLPGGAERP